MTDATGTTTRTYDELNRVLTKAVPSIGESEYVYDIITGVDAGCIKETSTDPKENVTAKIYDKTGRLLSVTAGGGTTAYSYYDNGSTESVTYPSGSSENYTYNDDDLLCTLTNKDADQNVMDTYSYAYDVAHNQTSKSETINSVNKGTTTNTYDELNRLETVTEPSDRETAYTYDAAGNRLTETITDGNTTTVNTYTYNSQNRLTGIATEVNETPTDTTVYEYDNNGNQLSTTVNNVETVTNTYDKLNRLVETVVDNGSTTTVTYAYNGDGLRVAKSVNSVLTRYLYEYDKVVLETNGSGNQTARNIYGTNLLMREADSDTYFYMYNGHADVTALIDSDGDIAATYYYDPFGNILSQTGIANNDVTYAGYQYDAQTGLYYCNARYYDPKIARFLSEDDSKYANTQDPLSLNLYTYCSNNPITYTDPTGHFIHLNFGNSKNDDEDSGDSIGWGGLWNSIKSCASNLWDKAKEAVSHPVDTLVGVGHSIVQGGSELIKDSSTVLWGLSGNTYMASQAWEQTSAKQEQLTDNIQNNLVKDQTAFNFGNTAGNAAQIAGGFKALFGGVKSLSDLPGISKSSSAAEMAGTGGNSVNIFNEESPVSNISKDVTKDSVIKYDTGNADTGAVNADAVTITNRAGQEVLVYRSGNDFTVKPGEIKVDKSTGLVTTQRGVSLNTDAGKISKFGRPYQIDSLPDGLQIKQVGSDPGHYEIVPEYPISQADFQTKLNQIKTSPVK